MNECPIRTQGILVSLTRADGFLRLKERPDLQIAWCFIGLLFIIGIAAPYIAPYNPGVTDLVGKNQGPSSEHPLGTDYLGRDLLSRVICGLSTSLTIALSTIILSFIIGVAVGSLAGYRGGITDDLVARMIDLFLAFPSVILALALMMLIGPGIFNMVLMLSIVQWASFARLTRGQVLAEKNQEYVLSSRAAGFSGWWTLTRHILPNCIMPVIVLATMDIGHTVLTISTLSFLGVGLPPAIPEWGSMINAGLAYMRIAPLNVIVPGLAITFVTLLFNIAGEGLRDLSNSTGDGEAAL